MIINKKPCQWSRLFVLTEVDMNIEYNGTIERLDRAAQRKAEKEGFIWSKEKTERVLAFDLESKQSREYYPVGFGGQVSETDDKVKLEGKITSGYLFIVLLAVAYALIIARGVFSFVNYNEKNLYIAIGAFVICVVVTVFMVLKIKKSKERLAQFLKELKI